MPRVDRPTTSPRTRPAHGDPTTCPVAARLRQDQHTVVVAGQRCLNDAVTQGIQVRMIEHHYSGAPDRSAAIDQQCQRPLFVGTASTCDARSPRGQLVGRQHARGWIEVKRGVCAEHLAALWASRRRWPRRCYSWSSARTELPSCSQSTSATVTSTRPSLLLTLSFSSAF